jgi:hypothetical protein
MQSNNYPVKYLVIERKELIKNNFKTRFILKLTNRQKKNFVRYFVKKVYVILFK